MNHHSLFTPGLYFQGNIDPKIPTMMAKRQKGSVHGGKKWLRGNVGYWRWRNNIFNWIIIKKYIRVFWTLGCCENPDIIELSLHTATVLVHFYFLPPLPLNNMLHFRPNRSSRRGSSSRLRKWYQVLSLLSGSDTMMYKTVRRMQYEKLFNLLNLRFFFSKCKPTTLSTIIHLLNTGMFASSKQSSVNSCIERGGPPKKDKKPRQISNSSVNFATDLIAVTLYLSSDHSIILRKPLNARCFDGSRLTDTVTVM